MRAVCGPRIGTTCSNVLDLLRHAVLEHLEVSGLETLDDSAVLRRVGVDADEVRADADRLLWLSRTTIAQIAAAAVSALQMSATQATRRMVYRTTRMALTTRCDLLRPTTSISMA